MKPPFERALTPEELANMPDKDIDYSDIPELDDKFWANAKIVPPRTKPSISLRLDPEIIKFFKAENPKGYTARMAAILRAYVKAQKEKP